MSVRELVTSAELRDRMLETGLGYSQSNGTEELRNEISRLYPGTTLENILVTNGGSEANFVATWSLLEPGDEVAFMVPNYMQIWGLARAFGATVRPFHLREEPRWAPDLEELKKAVSLKTKMIIVCNPNNPTGFILSGEAMKFICDLADRVGAWLLADEVYQGAELEGRTTASFWGHSEKVIITNGLSKAYGLPGLRIGWIVAAPDLIARFWSHHDYTTIGPGMLSDQLARLALRPDHREEILARTRKILQANYPILAHWVGRHRELFHHVPPGAGAIAYLRYDLDLNSTELVNRLLHQKSVLIVPGDHFGMDRYLRIGYGPEPDDLAEGLSLIDELLEEVRASRAPGD